MKATPRYLFLLLFPFLLVLSGCDKVPTEEEKQAVLQARIEAEAQKQYGNFQQLLASGRADLALNIAEHVLKNFPQTNAAAALKAEVEPLRDQITAEREARRLIGLWVYHDDEDEEAGGRVRSAYIFGKDPIGPAEVGKEAPRARLVLRRHPQWGDDVYLLSERGPFECPTPCQLQVQFDAGSPRTVAGEIPETGEHAIFVKDFDYFAAHLSDTDIVRIEASLKDGGAQTMTFEVGGYTSATIGSN